MVYTTGGGNCPEIGNSNWTFDQILYLKVPASSIPLDGVLCVVGVEEEPRDLLTSFVLAQNNPNPFGSSTVIAFSLPKESKVTLAIYDITGRMVKNLVDREMGAGNHTLRWDGKDQTGREVTSGIYFYRLKAGDFTQTNKMVVLR